MNFPDIKYSSSPFIFTADPAGTKGQTTYEEVLRKSLYSPSRELKIPKRKTITYTPPTSRGYYEVAVNQPNDAYLNPFSTSPFHEWTAMGTRLGITVTSPTKKTNILAFQTFSTLPSDDSSLAQKMTVTKWSREEQNLLAGAKDLFSDGIRIKSEVLVYDITKSDEPVFQTAHPHEGYSASVFNIQWDEKSTFWTGDQEGDLSLYDMRTKKKVVEVNFALEYNKVTSIASKANTLATGFNTNQLVLKDKRKLTDTLSSYTFKSAVMSILFLKPDRLIAGAGIDDQSVKFFDPVRSPSLKPYQSIDSLGQANSLAEVNNKLIVGSGFKSQHNFRFYQLHKNKDASELIGKIEKEDVNERVIQLAPDHHETGAYAYILNQGKGRVEKLNGLEIVKKPQNKKRRRSSSYEIR